MKSSIVKKISGLLLVLTGLIPLAFGDAARKESAVYDFSGNWLRYDKYYESYLPLKSQELKSAKSIHQVLDFEKYKNYMLKFEASQGLALFVNNKLIFKKINSGKEQVSIPVNTLEPDEEGKIIITFFQPEGILPFSSAFIVYESLLPVVRKGDEATMVFLARTVRDLVSDYALLFILMLTLFVLFKQTYPREYLRYYSFTPQENTDHLLPGPFSIPSLWMALINGLTLSLLIYIPGLDEVIFDSSYSILKGTVLITGAYFVFYIGKYLYLWLIAWVFNYSKVVSPQFAEYIRFFERVCQVACLILFGLVASGLITLSIKSEILYYSLIILLVFCVLKVILLFLRLVSHRNLYLFSYLCAAEVLPLIIAVKILLF